MSLQHIGKGRGDASTSGDTRATVVTAAPSSSPWPALPRRQLGGRAAPRCSAPAPRCCARTARPRSGSALVQPTEIRSQDGVLRDDADRGAASAADRRNRAAGVLLQRDLSAAAVAGSPRRRHAGDAAQRAHRRVHEPAFPRHERVAARPQRQRLHPSAAGTRIPLRGDDPARRPAGAGALLVSSARARLRHQADAGRHVRRVRGRGLGDAVSDRRFAAGAVLPDQARRAGRRPRDHHRQRAAQSAGRYPAGRDAVLADRQYRRDAVLPAADRRGCRSTSSRPTDIRWRSRRRSTRCCSAPGSASTPS